MKRGAANCPKMKRLGRVLGHVLGVEPMIGRHVATSVMHRLWEWAAEYAPSGELTGVDLDDLAEDLLWPRPGAELLGLLVDEKWCDWRGNRVGLHDWPDHCEHTVHNKLARARLFFWDGTAPKLGRLEKDERPQVQAWYAENPPPRARTPGATPASEKRTPGARRAHAGRTEDARRAPQPCLALPSPAEPSLTKCLVDNTPSGETAPEIAPPAETAGTPSPSRSRGESSKARARSVWPQCQEAAMQHGREWRELSDARLEAMAARLEERSREPPEILVHAIHGAVVYWQLTQMEDPTGYLTPETVYRRSNFTKYLESYRTEKPNGVAPKPRKRQADLADAVENIRADIERQFRGGGSGSD